MAVQNAARVTAVLGPTNTGKTHLAVERLCAHSSGIMGFPLRLLAREIYDRVVAIKGAANVGLVTGEEKILPPNARWLLTTVESMPQERDVAFVALDEAQIGIDPERGHVFTDRFLHARGREETMILGSDSLKPMVRALLPDAEIIHRPRFSKLEYAGPRKLTRLPPRSAVIGFSAEEVYASAELLRRTRGGAAVVMGALSPRTRNAQVEMFQSGEVDFLVATDAIGMGLNLDLGHVAFAGLSKFDGRRRRRLTLPEMAQIAGRAGRHYRNGSFGTVSASGSDAEFSPEEIERIEEHRFRPLSHLFWRNSDLDFRTPERLLQSLEIAPDSPELRLAPKAIDQEVLAILAAHPALTARTWSTALTTRLWDTCRIPDFMKRGPDFHASFIARIWEQLGSGQGVIAGSWIANELARLDSVQGDIDTISTRIAAARTWAFIANQPDWLEDPAHWIGRCSALEEKLSDALHARLTDRFVDRRAKMLRRAKENLSGPTTVQIDGDGTVRVEGEALGTLTGLSFRPDPAARHEDRKALLTAAERFLDREMIERAKALASAKGQEISLRLEPGEPVALIWRGVVAAQLSKGRSRLDPILKPDTSIARLSEPWRGQIIERLNRWLRTRIDDRLGRLRWVSRAAISPEQSAVVRAVLAALAEGLGTADRAGLTETLAELTPDQRSWLRQAGIVIGPLDIFIEALLKPGAAELRVALSCVAENAPMPPVPMPGLGLIDRPSEVLAKSARIAGYRRFGDQMIRIDHVNRIALALHKQRKGSEAFAPDVSVANRLGIGPPTLARILRATGFEPFGKPTDNQWRWRGLRRPRDRSPTLNPAFAVLKGLSRG